MNLNKNGMEFYEFLCFLGIFEEYCLAFIEDGINTLSGETVEEFLTNQDAAGYVTGAFIWKLTAHPPTVDTVMFWECVNNLWQHRLEGSVNED